MRKRALSLLLALVMCLGLAVPALAAEDGKELRMQWLDWTEDGQCYAGEQVLDQENPGENYMEFNPKRGDHVIFFLYDPEAKTKEFVVPEGKDNIKVEKVDAEGIAPDAQYSEYYVRLEMDGWKDGLVTYGELNFPLLAEYDDYSFYSAQKVSQENYLGDWDINVDQLKDRTLYLMNSYTGKDAEGRAAVTAVEKTGDHQSRWTLSKVNNNCWKITASKNAFDEEDYLRIEVKVQMKDSEGNTWEEERGISLFYERPTLWVVDLEWTENDEISGFDPENGIGNYMYVWPGMDAVGVVFGTCDTNEDGEPIVKTFAPIPASELKASEGLTLSTEDIPYAKGDKNAKYYVTASTDEFSKEYTVTWKDMSMTVSSRLPDLGLYWDEPEASVENWAGFYEHPISSVTKEDTFYLISTATDETNGFHLESAALTPDFEMNRYFTLTEGENGVYILEIKAGEAEEDEILAKLDVVWGDPEGNTWSSTTESKFVTVQGIDDAEGNHYSRMLQALMAQPEDGEAVLTLRTDFQSYDSAIVLGSSDYGGLMGGETVTVPCKDITIDLNGHILRGEKDCAVFEVQDGYSLTIIDSSEAKTGKLITQGETDVVVAEGGKYTPLPTQEPEQPKTDAEAMPTNDSLTSDGAAQTPTVYKINDSNYFKIRDLAAILNGTEKQFSVGYDADLNSVTTKTGEGYEKLDSDLVGAPAGGNKTAVVSNDTIYVNGEKVAAEVYKIDGSNYFKLRDLGKAFNFYVGWTAEQGMFIETDKPYAE